MSDMLSLGASGITAYQRALATVSNNIANVATDGYSRQSVSFQATAPKALGTNYVGTGVMVEAIVRQYDAFIESNLRGSLSDLKSQSPLVTYANRVVDLMADESTSLSLAMGQFFTAARDLAAEPASLIARNVFLRGADSTANGFRLIADQLNSIEEETRVGISDIPNAVNTIAEQLSLVNKQLGRTPMVENQPADLLDERDRLLRDMSEKVRINTQFANNGEVKVSLTDNFEQGIIVERDQAQKLGLDVGGDGRVTMVLNPNSPQKRETLGSLSGGELGGLLAFREQVLKPMQENLNLLAKTFMDEVNSIHSEGVDAMGRPGENLFTLSNEGSPAAESITVNVADPQRVAAASAFRITAEPLNPGDSLARVSYTSPSDAPVPALNNVVSSINTHPDASISLDVQNITPFATVPAGSENSIIYMDPDGDQWLQVMTRDGRQLLGNPLTTTEQNLLFADNANNGLALDATYSSTYINKPTGDESYLGLSYFIGARAQPAPVAVYDAQSHLQTGSTIAPAKLTSERLSSLNNALTSGNLTLNGVSIPAASSANAFISWVNTQAATSGSSLTGLSARMVNEVSVPTGAIKLANDRTLSINGTTVSMMGISSYSELAQTITDQLNGTGLQANIAGSGELVLSTQDGSPITIAGTAMPEGSFNGRIEIVSNNTTQSIALGFTSNGSPQDLEKIGFRTAAYLDGKMPEDLLVFVSGTGTAKLAASSTTSNFDAQEALRSAPFTIEFGNNNTYTITDDATGTVLAARSYDTATAAISYRGLTFTFNSVVASGDKFYFDNNANGSGDNENMIRLSELQDRPVIGSYTFSEAYVDYVQRAGNAAQQAALAEKTLSVVYDQAVLTREDAVGVNLDEEAASLIRYQQAYQANAKIIQVAGNVFDTLLSSL
jgi:flagellar hook-associated protein FlgK